MPHGKSANRRRPSFLYVNVGQTNSQVGFSDNLLIDALHFGGYLSGFLVSAAPHLLHQ